jgi:methionine-rich copper-binding protein CopC
LSGSNWSTGIISVSSIAVNYPSQSIHLAFSGSGSGLSADLDTGAISGSFNSFHFTTPLLDVTASGSISVVGSSVLSSIDVVGVLDELSITYPKDNILLSILGDIDYTQDASGQFHYNGSATEIHFNKAGADLAIKGEVLCAFDDQNGLSLSGSVHEIDVQIGDTIIECIGDIHFGKNGIESGDINNLSISVNGNYYDASTLNLKDLIADFGGDGVVYLDQNGDWYINDATFPQFSDTIDYLLDKINPTPPTVTTFTPSDAATGVAVGSDIVLTFSEAIQAGTGAIEIHRGSATGALVEHYDAATSHNLIIAGNTLTINPTADLSGGKHYYVTFADGSIKDIAGNNFAGTSIYDFTTANMSTIALIPTKNPLDFFYISASQGGTLYDTDKDGVIDHVRVWGLGTSTGYFRMEWSDATHWTAKGLATLVFGGQYDSQGRPTTCIINGAELPVNWASPGNADHLLATVTRVNGTLSEMWKVFDSNSDNQPDEGIYTATTEGEATTTITSNVVALTQDSYGRPTSFISEFQTSTNPRDVFSGTVTGSSSDATAIQLPLGSSGAYSLIAAGTLVDSFTIYPSLIGRLYDMDGNNVIDQMDLVSTAAGQNGQSTTNIYSFALNWSDRTHWTAHLEAQMAFGTTFDAYGRPTAYVGVEDGLVHDIVWQNKGADNIVATSSYAGQNSGELVVVSFIDSLGDSNPDEIIYVKSNGSTEIERSQANIFGWTNNSTAVTVVIQTATNPTLVFTGSVTGSNMHAQDILVPLFTGNSGEGSTLISTKHQVDVFNISATDIGRLYDMDSNGIIDRMDVASTTTGQSGQTNTSIKSYALSWNDTAHWTAHAAYELLFGLQYDGQGRPTTIFMNGGEQTINWATTVTNGVLATVPSVYDGIAATLTLLDTNADSKPDAFDYTEGSGSTLQTGHGTLDWWVTDSSNHPVAVSLVAQTSSNPADSFSGSVTGSSSNPTAIVMPVMNSGETTGDRVSNNMLIFDLGVTSPLLDAQSHITVKDGNFGGGITSVTLAASSLSVNGSFITIPLSGTDASGNPYSLPYDGGTRLLVDLPAGIAGQPDPIVKAWVVNSMNNGGYSLSSMRVVGTTGTVGMDWVTGTSGNDSITAGAGNDLIEWSGGNDTVDAGDGYDSVNLPLNSKNAFHWLDGNKVLHIGSATNTSLDVYHITKNSDTSFRVDKLKNDGTTVESTMNLSNAESMGFGNQIHQFQVNYAGGQYVTGTPWDDQIFLNAANIGNLIQVHGDFGHDILLFNVGSGYSKLEFVNNGTAYLLKGTAISDGSVVELGHAVPSLNGNTVTMTIGSGVNAHSFTITDIEAFRFVSDAVKVDFAPDSLSSNVLSFDLGVQSPELAALGHLTVVAADVSGYLTTVTLDVSRLVVVDSHLSIPMSGTDANGNSYWLNAQSGSKLFVELPADLLVGHDAQSHAWQVGNMSNTSMSLTPINAGAGDDPTVTTFSPVDGATGVSVGSNIVLTFSEPILKGTGAIEIRSGTSDGALIAHYELATSSNLTIAGNTLTINPTADLAGGTHYFVTFGNGNFTDFSGNPSTGSNTYDFTTEALPLHQNLTGSATFWKTGTPIAGVTSSLTTAMGVAGAHPVEFRNIQLADDGTRTLELWETSASPVESAQLDFTLSSGLVATWQDSASLSPGWISMANTGISGQFILGSIGTTPLSAGPVKLGTLTLTAPTNPQHFELLLTSGQLNHDTIPTFGIASDSSTTGADGLYSHVNMPDGTYALTNAKVSGIAEANAVNANDALAALKMAVAMNPNSDSSPVSPYQYLAADVNKDGVIRATDALNILKMAVKLDTAPAKEWLFVPESVGSESMSRTHVIWPDNPVPVTLDVDQEMHLIGIVRGDVDGSWLA